MLPAVREARLRVSTTTLTASIYQSLYYISGFPGSLAGKEAACNAGDPGSISELGRSPGEGNGYPHSSILAWRIPWTEEPGRLQPMGLQRVRHD